jgi:hypothetical protein
MADTMWHFSLRAHVEQATGNTSREATVASPLNKIIKFIRSPRGQRLLHQARRRARDPRTRHQINQVVRRLKRRY